MDSSLEERIQDALVTLKETGVSYILMVEDDHGIAVFSNSKGDRLYFVE